MEVTRCKRCGALILWARQAGGRKWYPLEPEIVGQPRSSDWPLNAVERVEGHVLCHLYSREQEHLLSDTAELHRRHTCKGGSMTYTVENLTIGRVEQEEVRSMLMPREDFMEIVANALDFPQYDAIRDEMLEVASTMPRFPIGTWLNPNRGCGCVIGEYLVAHAEIERAELMVRVANSTSRVEDLLSDNPNYEALIKFGTVIDDRIIKAIHRAGYQTHLYFDDEPVRSVEIIDG